MTEVWIDLNVRVHDGETFSGFEDVKGIMPHVGDRVLVREPESNIVGEATVTRVDAADQLIYMAVDWAALAPETLLTPDQLISSLRAAGQRPTIESSELQLTSRSPFSSTPPGVGWDGLVWRAGYPRAGLPAGPRRGG
jgi:hypothetical protein